MMIVSQPLRLAAASKRVLPSAEKVFLPGVCLSLHLVYSFVSLSVDNFTSEIRILMTFFYHRISINNEELVKFRTSNKTVIRI